MAEIWVLSSRKLFAIPTGTDAIDEWYMASSGGPIVGAIISYMKAAVRQGEGKRPLESKRKCTAVPSHWVGPDGPVDQDKVMLAWTANLPCSQ